MQKEKKAKYLAIIWIGGGSSWATGLVDIDTAVSAVKYMKQDWSHLFKFKKKDAYPVNVYNVENGGDEGWWSDGSQVFDTKSQKPFKFYKTFWVVN